MLRLVQLATAIVVLIGVFYRYFPPTIHQDVRDYAHVDIGELLKHSRDYDGKPVTVSGTVVANAGVLGVGEYRIRQNDADILIVSKHGIPGTGTVVTLKGLFSIKHS
jgi:hypothetical protein